jgi:hypothetical protein
VPDLYLLRYIGGRSYQGYDPGRQCHIEVAQGQLIEVSAEKRRQLVVDFPGEWDDFGMQAPVNVPEVAPNVLELEQTQPRRRGRPRNVKPAEPTQEK